MQLFCKSKTILKLKVYFKKEKKEYILHDSIYIKFWKLKTLQRLPGTGLKGQVSRQGPPKRQRNIWG